MSALSGGSRAGNVKSQKRINIIIVWEDIIFPHKVRLNKWRADTTIIYKNAPQAKLFELFDNQPIGAFFVFFI